MKNIYLFTVVLILFVNPVFSQEDTETWSKSLDIMAVPQGGIDLTNTQDGFSNQSNVFVVVNFTKGKNTLTSFYSVTNSVGMAYSRSLSEDYGMYAVATKNVLTEGGYLGVGATKNVGKSAIFIEIGSPWNTWLPGLSIGVFIPVTFKI